MKTPISIPMPVPIPIPMLMQDCLGLFFADVEEKEAWLVLVPFEGRWVGFGDDWFDASVIAMLVMMGMFMDATKECIEWGRQIICRTEFQNVIAPL